jgi:hypothetical protein
MPPSQAELRVQLDTELKRLGLRREDLPGGGLAFGLGGLEHFVARLKALAPGASWRDALPEIPPHWQGGRPETWTRPYRPYGLYDYQELPTAPAVHITWTDGGADRLSHLVTAARAQGWHIFGGGLLPTRDGLPEYHAIIVMERGTTEKDLSDFVAWVDAQVGFSLAAIPRLGTEHYLRPGEVNSSGDR